MSGVALVSVADHREQRQVALLAVEVQAGIEDLVPAMLGVRLREHHQLDIGWGTAQGDKTVRKIIDLVR